MSDSARIQAMIENGARGLVLENIRPMGPGMSRAMQQLRIRNETVSTDEVLIEEIRFASPERMHAEIDSLTIKAGMLSPFAETSTPSPKYCYTDDIAATSWLVTSVPRTSLGAILDDLARRFPTRYTGDQFGHAKDMIHAGITALASTWKQSKNPLTLFRAVHHAIKQIAELRISSGERLQFASGLVDAIAAKHAKNVIHYNISRNTIFFSDALSPRFLNNYAGEMPAWIRSILPEQLQTAPPTSPYGGQFCDVYMLAHLVYEIITGESLDPATLSLDEARTMPPEPGILHFRHFEGTFEYLNDIGALINDAYQGILSLWFTARAIVDESKWPRYRRLVRASGGFFRSIPILRLFTDILFPTPAAQALRSILDKKQHQTMLAGIAGAYLTSISHKRIDIHFLKSNLPARALGSSAKLSAILQTIIDAIDNRPVDRYEEEKTSLHILRKPGVRRGLWYAAWAIVILILVTVFDSQLFGPRMLQNQKKTAVTSPDNHAPKPVTGKQNQIRQLLSDKQKPIGPIQGEETEPPFLPPADNAIPCRPYLSPVPGYIKVYRIRDWQPGCGIGDLIFIDENGQTTAIRNITNAYTRFYILQQHDGAWDRILSIRLCLRGREGFVKGAFYEAVGASGFGKQVVASDSDLFAFNSATLARYKNDHSNP
jgi:hypothetical protein